MKKSKNNPHQMPTLPQVLSVMALSILTSCSSLRQNPQPVREVHTDTMYIQQHSYDSIPPAPDTIIITNSSTEYRYKLLRDTIRLIHTDTIPYKVTVTKTKPVPHIPWWTKALILTLPLTILLLLLSKR